MHMADALLSPAVGGAMYAVSAGSVGWAVRKLNKEGLGEEKLPFMAVSGAFVFAAQMINFSIPGTGSSGHIGGGMLLAGLLGGPSALLTITAVLIVQCLLFADGGLLALGANVFNMGVIPCLLVWPFVYRPLLRRGLTTARLWLACVLSAVLSLQLGAFCVVLQTLLSGVTELPFGAFVALMQPIHLAIGVVEGIVTAAVLSYVYRTRPELADGALTGRTPGASPKTAVAVLAVLAALTAGGLSLLASGDPDGLEWSIENVTGSTELERADSVHNAAAAVQERFALLPDYDFADGAGTGTTASGLIGAAVTCALAGAVGFAITSAKRRKHVGHSQ